MIQTTYVIASDPYDGWAKIGYTAGIAPYGRLSSLQTGNPRRLCAVAYWFSYVELEAQMHAHFAPLRGCGEWFALPSALLMEMSAARHDENDRKTFGGQEFADILRRWPVERILALAECDATPEMLAREFSAPATRPTTPQFRIVADAG